MSVKPISKSSCCFCFGKKKEKTQIPALKHHEIHTQRERFHSYRPTDINQIVDPKIVEQAQKAEEIFKETEK